MILCISKLFCSHIYIKIIYQKSYLILRSRCKVASTVGVEGRRIVLRDPPRITTVHMNRIDLFTLLL
jgi:hypothetical protein